MNYFYNNRWYFLGIALFSSYASMKISTTTSDFWYNYIITTSCLVILLLIGSFLNYVADIRSENEHLQEEFKPLKKEKDDEKE